MKNVIEKNKYFHLGLTIFMVIAACILFFFLIYKINIIIGAGIWLFKLSIPFIIGFVIAYLLNPIVKFFREVFRKLLKKSQMVEKKKLKLANNLAIFITCLLTVAILILLFSFVIPELLQSVTLLVSNIPFYLEEIKNYLLDSLKNNEDLEKMVLNNYEAINTYLNNSVNNTLLPILNEWIISFSNGMLGAVKSLFNVIMGFIISIYFLGDKSTFKAQIKKALYSIFSIKTANNIVDNARYTDRIFGNFIIGKLLDAAFIAVITFIFLTIFNYPYALLISVIAGTTNIIPYFGPFIGGIPSALILFIQNPSQGLIYVIFVIILQQIDGNYIEPKIVGSRTGIKSFWVLFAILFFGSLFGILGMLIGVPIFGLLYGYISRKCNEKLIKKDLPIETYKYEKLNRINSENKKIVENKE